MNAVSGVEVHVLWSCTERCVELLELSVREPSGYCRPFRYEVHIQGEPRLYESESEYAARHYLGMLLDVPVGELGFEASLPEC